MKVIGITCMIIGVIFGTLNTIDKNKLGMIAAGLAFASGMVSVLTN